VRLALGLLASLAVMSVSAACGGEKPCTRHGVRCENLPRTKVYRLDWADRAPRGAAVFRVSRIEVGAHGWTIDASVTNGSRKTFAFPKGGASSPLSFGLGVFSTRLPRRVEESGNYLLKPRTVRPPFPTQLRPGQTWSGTLASSVPPRASRWLRVLFGVFFWEGKPPYDFGPFFAWQTSKTVQSPPPRGPNAAEPGRPG
jgi:hypothetical protein